MIDMSALLNHTWQLCISYFVLKGRTAQNFLSSGLQFHKKTVERNIVHISVGNLALRAILYESVTWTIKENGNEDYSR